MKMYEIDNCVEKCCFVEGFTKDKREITCNAPAIGRLGLKTGNYVCREHFDYARNIYGIHKSDIVHKKVRAK